ncbi:MAG: 5-dehydro-4-deoxy-D-glucuronate isomerase [Planctomycetes bacterium RBG_13_46_10]|nr:MAG: 5-dehydro-4-deoxy-D-glucuronate isomerase [Planctomycetes bacterium RBG_13_46_10]
MKVRYLPDPVHFCTMTTEEIRENFLIESLFQPDSIEMVYSEADRAIVGSAVPVNQTLKLTSAKELRADYFCQRRELGVLNIGRSGTITVDGQKYKMTNLDCLYIGRGSKEILFASDDSANPAQFYLLSYPAHKEYPTSHIPLKQASPVHLGSVEESNKRTICKCVHPEGVKSCQLVMGFTFLEPGCVWNTMPAHTHERRTEVYMYFNMPEKARVFHFTGKPGETRHIAVANRQAVISPSWSIHSGVGTSAYTFCWGMGGENQDFDDMDHLIVEDIR